MERVTGIGGIFFKARDPESLGEWYARHLGVEIKNGCADFHWTAAGQAPRDARTVWSIFPPHSDYFPGAVMINYRVDDLEKLLAQLRAAGVAIDKTESFDYGHFAWLMDPEGNRVELWQPTRA